MSLTTLKNAEDVFKKTRFKGIVTKTIKVTPLIAEEWLNARGPRYRKLSLDVTDQICWDIRHDAWDLTHESIAFNTREELIDGQSRLSAVVHAQKSVAMRVSVNVPIEVAPNINRGLTRSAADALNRSAADISVVRALIRLETIVSRPPSSRQFTDAFSRCETELAWARRALRGNVTPAVMAAFMYARPVEPRKVAAFAEAFTEWARPEPTHPVCVLRHYLAERERNQFRVSKATLTCIRAFCEDRALNTDEVALSEHDGRHYFEALRARPGR